MDVAFVDDHVSVTCWPAWAEVGEALRATLGDGDGASCAAAIDFFPLAISASATKPNKTVVRSERKRIVFNPSAMEHTWSWKPAMPPALVPGLRNCTTMQTVLRNGIETSHDGTRGRVR